MDSTAPGSVAGRSRFRIGLLLLIVLVACYPPVRLSLGSIYRFNYQLASPLDSDFRKLALYDEPAYQIVRWVSRNLGREDAILVFRQSDAGFYLHDRIRRIYSDIDPVVLPLFTAGDKREILSLMKDLDISYIATPAYSMPSVYNSQFTALLADPQLATLVFDRGSRIYRINPVADTVVELTQVQTWEFSGELLADERWSYWQNPEGFGQLRDLAAKSDLQIRNTEQFALLRDTEERSSLFYTGRGTLDIAPFNSFSDLGLESGRTYRFDMEYRGSGHLMAHLVQYAASGAPLGRKFLWGSVVTDTDVQAMSALFRLDPQAVSARILLEITESATFFPVEATLYQVDTDRSKLEDQRNAAAMGWSVRTVGAEEDLGDVADWGLSEEGVYLVQAGSNAIALQSPEFQVGGAQGLCVTVKGQGTMKLKISIPTDCDNGMCPILVGELGTYLLKDTPTELLFDLDRIEWDIDQEKTHITPIRASNQMPVELHFELNHDNRYLGTRHMYPKVEVLGIYRIETGGSCATGSIVPL